MKKYRQITSGERYAIAALRRRTFSIRAIAVELDRSPSTISRMLSISHETIYVHVWRNKRNGGELWQHLRQAGKKRRKR